MPCALPSLSCALFFFFLSSSLCFPLELCLSSPPAFHTPFYVSLSLSVYHPLMLLLWSVFMISLSFSLSANLLVCCRDGIADWLWFILTPASVLWLAQSWHAYTHTLWHTHTHRAAFSRPEFTRLASTLPQIPERSQDGHQTCSAVMWLDMEDMDSAFPQISTSVPVVLPRADFFPWILEKTVTCKDTERIVCMHCVWGNVSHMCFMAHACPLCDYAASCVWDISVYVSVWLKMSVYVETCGAQQQRREEWYTVISCFMLQGAVTKVFFFVFVHEISPSEWFKGCNIGHFGTHVNILIASDAHDQWFVIIFKSNQALGAAFLSSSPLF